MCFDGIGECCDVTAFATEMKGTHDELNGRANSLGSYHPPDRI